jgi:calcineurin-like phosphoesterase family protein
MPRLFLFISIAFSILIEGPSHAVLLCAQNQQDASAVPFKLPLKPKSVRFAAIGDNGTGTREQYDVAAQMDRFHQRFPFEFVVMLGDNIYGGKTAADYKLKFEDPYKPLLDGGVKFYASLGNHDDPNERSYKPFNMGGKRYYSFKNGNVTFFALDSNYMDPEQVSWLQQQLSGSSSDWKICFLHHPLHSDGQFHGSDVDLRARIEPIFEKNGVNVVLSGHDHVYERIAPQHGISYFVIGNSGQLRFHNLRPSSQMMKGYDEDCGFALFEIAGDELYFQIISRKGETIDSGVISRKSNQPSAFLRWNAP